MTLYVPRNLVVQDARADKLLPMYMSCGTTDVPDLWYERRPGPTQRERQHAKVFNTDVMPDGRFSALCHAKFLQQDTVLSTGEAPLLEQRQFYVKHGTGYLALTPEQYIQYWNGCTVYAWWLVPGGSKSETIVGWLQASLWPKYGRMYGCTLSYMRHDNPHPLSEDHEYAYVYIPGNYAIDWNISYESAAAMVSQYWKQPEEISSWYHTWQPWDIKTHALSPQQVQALIDSALHSALRYDDKQLVDWSVDERAPMPQALQNIDLIEGKAMAFIEATKEIPLASENMLQNIAAAFLGLSAFAFNDEGAGKLFKSLTRGCPDVSYHTAGVAGAQRAKVRSIRLKEFEEHVTNLIHSPVNRASKTGADTILPSTSEKLDYFGDKWLSGRYVWSTGVVDMGNTWDYFYDQALQWIGKRSGDYKCHARQELRDFVFQCTFTAREKALDGFARMCQQSYRLGTDINMYVIWDFIPFSFVVDWFVPIGNSLNAYTRASKFCPEYWAFRPLYDGKAFCYSIQYTSDTPLGKVSVYTRWYERECPPLEESWILRHDSASSKTCCKRAIDGLALFHF